MSDNPTLDTLPPKSLSQKCPVCGNVNRPGVLVCENCGTNLLNGKGMTIGTREFQSEVQKPDAPANETHVAAVDSAGTPVFEDNMMLRLEIDDLPTPIIIFPKQETSLGRRDPGTGTAPDIDLTAYAGYRKGVSRRHAMLRLRERKLEVYDLGSSNGTAVNGIRLSAHQPHPLKDGDEISLGKMHIRVLFQARNRPRV